MAQFKKKKLVNINFLIIIIEIFQHLIKKIKLNQKNYVRLPEYRIQIYSFLFKTKNWLRKILSLKVSLALLKLSFRLLQYLAIIKSQFKSIQESQLSRQIMKSNQSLNCSLKISQSGQSCQKKCKAPIIPKIKLCCNDQVICAQDNFTVNSNLVEEQNKIHFNQDIKVKVQGGYTAPSHLKGFPHQENLQKMTKQQLVQTYYQQFLRLHKQNEALDIQLAYVRGQRDLMYKKYNDLKELQNESSGQKPKRQRRRTDEIERNYNCPVRRCNRSYGSEGSLLQHIKIKHEQFYNSSEYENLVNKRKQEFPQKSQQPPRVISVKKQLRMPEINKSFRQSQFLL